MGNEMREATTCNFITRDAVRQAIVDGFNTLYASDQLFEDAVERCFVAVTRARNAEVEQLTALTQNGDSAIDTNKRLLEAIESLRADLAVAVELLERANKGHCDREYGYDDQEKWKDDHQALTARLTNNVAR